MRLTELEPDFLIFVDERNFRTTDDVGEADGVMFLCPKCYVKNGGPVGTHRVICWTPKVPADVNPKPGRWDLVGTGYGDLTLRAGSSSVLLQGGCEWHGFVRNGEVTGA